MTATYTAVVSRVRHARDRERLQSLIQELDELAMEVDPAVLLEAEKRAKKVNLYQISLSPSK